MNASSESEAPEAIGSAAEAPAAASAVRGAILLLAFGALLVAPIRILGEGWLPTDDALRHAAKAVSGRAWSDVLLLRPEFVYDLHPGWHAILSLVHRALGATPGDLVLFSVVVLFLVYSVGPLLLLRRPECWLFSLALMFVADPAFIGRLVTGRPYLLSSALIPIFVLLWPRLGRARPAGADAAFVVLAALATWIHGSYELLALPVLALLAARRIREAARLAAEFAVGIVLGAVLTGHPLGFLYQVLVHGYLALGTPKAATGLVAEFQPFEGRGLVVAGFLALLALRPRRPDRPSLGRDPALLLAGGCWALGFVSGRFWFDWGAPAVLAIVAVELQELLEGKTRAASTQRVSLAAAGALLVVLAGSADLGGRWSDPKGTVFLSEADPQQAPWLPDPGGIAYSADMEVFYTTFFRNPYGRWKYVLGFEPAIMPKDDYRIFLNIRRSRGSTESYEPWVAKMKPADRLYVRIGGNAPPPIPGLEWAHPAVTLWVGRLPRATHPGDTSP